MWPATRDVEALRRVRILPELATSDDERLASDIQRRHCLAVIARELGFDPDDPDWDRIGRDWVKPRDRTARARLYGKLIAQRFAKVR
jgi:hypothetical protein